MTDFPGEFEQMVLLAILQLGESAHAIEIRRRLLARANRSVSRGALYRTLDRMVEKGLVDYREMTGDEQRGNYPRRLYEVTEEGVVRLSHSRKALLQLWDGVEGLLEDAG